MTMRYTMNFIRCIWLRSNCSFEHQSNRFLKSKNPLELWILLTRQSQNYSKFEILKLVPNDKWTRPTYISGRVYQYTMGKCFTLLHPRRKLSIEIKILTFSLAGLEVINSSAFISYVLQVQVLLRSCQTNLISSCYILPFPLLHYLAQNEPF